MYIDIYINLSIYTCTYILVIIPKYTYTIHDFADGTNLLEVMLHLCPLLHTSFITFRPYFVKVPHLIIILFIYRCLGPRLFESLVTKELILVTSVLWKLYKVRCLPYCLKPQFSLIFWFQNKTIIFFMIHCLTPSLHPLLIVNFSFTSIHNISFCSLGTMCSSMMLFDQAIGCNNSSIWMVQKTQLNASVINDHYRNPVLCRVPSGLSNDFLQTLDKEALCRVPNKKLQTKNTW